MLRVLPRVCTRIPRRPSPLQYSRRPFHSSSSSRRSYHPGYFRFLDDIPEDTVFWSIIGLNGAVFAMAWWAKKKLEVERNPALYRWFQKNFTSSWNNISAGRIWTPVTSAFAHADFSHILFNGFTFYFMAPLTLSILGSRQFLFLYLGGICSIHLSGGASAALGSVAYTNIWRGRDVPSVGASGAIYSVLSFLAFQAPRMTLLLYGIIPVPIYLAVGGLFSYDLYRTVQDNGGKTNTSAHVGGALAGAAYFFLRRFRMF
ncbi:hypothetical protein B0H17DRAFT_1252938 [Mycena rosella]|uniref:Peptidase S54 rhomboid domain-containing protein n=1 Tax=Mycena rosella TaxID=1033263 RepID=A0AAD7DVB3_MYCRO|nr:hypothetical protein B0H17DRAFT_1252938 [Mycena rosella]